MKKGEFMWEFIKNLLPDEIGEIFGLGLFSGGSYLGIKHFINKEHKAKTEREELENKLNQIITKQNKEFSSKEDELKKKIKNSCLSDEALNFIKNNFKEEK